MSAISSVGSQPPGHTQAPPPPAKPVADDGDHDNDATESGAAKAQEASVAQHVLNVKA